MRCCSFNRNSVVEQRPGGPAGTGWARTTFFDWVQIMRMFLEFCFLRAYPGGNWSVEYDTHRTIRNFELTEIKWPCKRQGDTEAGCAGGEDAVGLETFFFWVFHREKGGLVRVPYQLPMLRK